jgi:Flp pilus assembly protein TadG
MEAAMFKTNATDLSKFFPAPAPRVNTGKAKGVLARFADDSKGNTAVLFTILLMPLVSAIGVAVDYSRVSSARTTLAAALDAGVVAAASENNTRTQVQLEKTVRDMMKANGAVDLPQFSVKVTAANDWTVNAEARACIPLAFSSMIGVNESCVQAVAEAQRGKNQLEIALVLDNTGSMDNASDRIGNLRVAARQLVDVLEKSVSGKRQVKISLVPFVTAVNVRGEGFDWSWIDRHAKNPLHGVNFDHPTGGRVNHFDLFDKMQLNWKGCVEARPGPHNLTDTAPGDGDPSTLFVPYFAPDEPGNAAAGGNSGSAFNNSYLNDQHTGTNIQRQRSIAKYDQALPRPVAIVEHAPNLKGGMNITNGPNRACPTPIVPLTADFGKLRNNIDAMRHWNGSGTNVSEGLSWGLRVLSPNKPYALGRPWNEATTQKVVVLLTDGENVVFGSSGTMNRSDYGSYGFLANGRFGATNQTDAARNVDGWTQQVCDNLKSKGVMIYTITLEAGTPANRALYGKCATRPDMYFDSPSASQLSGIFTNIAQQLVSLKITK